MLGSTLPDQGGEIIGGDISVPALLAGQRATLRHEWPSRDHAGSNTLWLWLDPAGLVEETSEEFSDRLEAVHELEERLTASLPTDPAEQSEAHKATWLLRHLLDWHRRENKSAWWRFYDLMSKSDDELFEDAEPIGRLEFVERIVREGKRISTDDFRYRFPAQEHRIDVGVDVHDPEITAKGAKHRHMVRVEAHLADGTVMKRTVEAARGSEQKFASDADIVEKFEKLAIKALPRDKVGRLRDAMLGLEKLDDAAELARLMARA